MTPTVDSAVVKRKKKCLHELFFSVSALVSKIKTSVCINVMSHESSKHITFNGKSGALPRFAFCVRTSSTNALIKIS